VLRNVTYVIFSYRELTVVDSKNTALIASPPDS